LKLEGSVIINAPRDKVWDYLIDADAVSKCAPGLESMEIITPDKEFRIITSIALGTAKIRFTSHIEWLKMEKPNRAKMAAHGHAPGGNSMKVTSEMELTSSNNSSTEINWTADVVVLGRIAGLARRFMGSVTRKLTTEFFDCVKKNIES
jgi:carbon monoxide dehydrogenase subunit G